MDCPYCLSWTSAYTDFQPRMQSFEPPCPMLYIFGRHKPLQFHSPSWAANLAAQPCSRLAGMDTSRRPMLKESAEFNEAVPCWFASDSASMH